VLAVIAPHPPIPRHHQTLAHPPHTHQMHPIILMSIANDSPVTYAKRDWGVTRKDNMGGMSLKNLGLLRRCSMEATHGQAGVGDLFSNP
jgi:hypothetical protein